MSADNGIYVLESPSMEGSITEFRVAHAMAIDNLGYYEAQDPELARYYEYLTFRESPIFADKQTAMAYASHLYDKEAQSGFMVEYGIRVLHRREQPFLDCSHDEASRKLYGYEMGL